MGRAICQKLTEQLGQSFVIDNKPGASGIIGTDQVAKAAPDGYTLLVSSGTTFTVNPATAGESVKKYVVARSGMLGPLTAPPDFTACTR